MLSATVLQCNWCWVTAHLYDQQIFIGVIAVTQGCCQAVLQSSTEQWEVHLPETVLQCIGGLGHCTLV